MIKRYKLNTGVSMGGNKPFMSGDTRGEWVKHEDVKDLLERSDNSDYAVTPSASPKGLNDLLDRGDDVVNYIKEHQGSDLYRKLFRHFA